MKNNRNYPIAIVTKKAEKTLKYGHTWVYDTEITNNLDSVNNGALCDVVSPTGTYLGTGLLSKKSKIRIRILSDNANETFGDNFWTRRVRYALDYRRTVMGDDFSSCRLIFGEADGIPGLTVDRFSDILVTEVLSYGIEQRKDVIYGAILDTMTSYGEKISGIYERNESKLRELEGLEIRKGWYSENHPESTKTVITENGIEYEVDFENGQKTGYFLDQKYNRLEIMRLAKGKKVLDCFTHTGSFALNAAKGGAEKVTAVDISELALAQARRNAERNHLDSGINFVCADIFDFLPSLKGKKDYDFIILDPPAFTKSRKTIDHAEKGYKEINMAAMKLLPRGGYFATCSCSHFMKDDLFRQMLFDASLECGVKLKQIEARQQACDHPILWNMPETDYLKFYIFQVI